MQKVIFFLLSFVSLQVYGLPLNDFTQQGTLNDLIYKITQQEQAVAKAEVPSNEVCPPVRYPYDDCFNYIMQTKHWYFGVINCDQDDLMYQCDYYTSKDKATLERIKAHGCYGGPAPKEGCKLMVDYSLGMRNEEERCNRCKKNQEAIQELESSKLALESAKQKALAEIESAKKTMLEISSTINTAESSKTTCIAQLKAAQDAVQMLSDKLQIAKLNGELAKDLLKEQEKESEKAVL